MNQKEILQLGRIDLINFSILTDPRYKPNWHHLLIADYLERVEKGEIKRLIIEMPPRSGKSQLASINFPAYYLGRNPDKEIITSSYSGDLASDFGQKTRDLVRDQVYQGIFPEIKLKEDTQAKNKWMTEQKGSYISTGVGGALTGRGANILLLDDVVKNSEDANSETMREKTWQWFISTAYTRLAPNGAVVLIMTRWHQDDLAGRIQEMDENNEWTVLSLPEIAEQDEEWDIKGVKYTRKQGEVLWQDRYPLEEVLKIKNQIGIYQFSCLYQQNPVNTENQVFKKEWFTYYEEYEIVNKDLEVYAMVDLATWDKSDKNDNTSIQVIGKEHDSNIIYKLEDFTGRYNPTEIIDYLFYLKDKYKMSLIEVGIETNGYQKSLEFFLKQEMDKRGKPFSVKPIVSRTSKELRIRGLVPFYENRLIKHRSNGKDNALEDEMLVFPFGKHDDRIDSMALMLQTIEETDHKSSAKSFTPDYNKLY
jgi:predicted phage terminase large subunit-like protein